MNTRLATATFVAVVAAAVVTGCGGNARSDGAEGGRDGPRATMPDVTAQVAARKLIAAKRDGGCDCTGEARARERLADGRAERQSGSVVLGPR